MPQHPDITKITKLLIAQSMLLKARGHRQIVILSGSLEWATALATSLITLPENANPSKSLCTVTSKDSSLEKLISKLGKSSSISIARPEKPNTLLGYENSHAIFDAHSGFNPDALCAISGTITAGGFLIVLTPDLDLWPKQEDAFAKKRLSFGYPQIANSPQTIKRFLDTAIPLGAIHINEQQSWQELKEHINTKTETRNSRATTTTWKLPTEPTPEQKQVLDDISNDAQKLLIGQNNKNSDSNPVKLKQKKSFHIIQADRGRGKSHLLGLIACKLTSSNIDNGIKPIITAPNKMSIQAVNNALECNSTNKKNTTPLIYMAPENVLSEGFDANILIVDEAASLPIPLLKQWTKHFEFIIFATTTHGYEGTGKGFQIRFLHFLNALKQTTRQHNLSTPIRYNYDDPTENTLFKTFCLDSEPSGLKLTSVDSHEIEQMEVSQTQLNSEPRLLEEVFSLLVQAHYQTRPSDLRDLLDAPGLRVFVSRQKTVLGKLNTQAVLAACLVFDEGNLDPKNTDIVNAICEGKRRPKGHLTPQVLTLHMGQENALYLKSARIVRIATLPNLQRSNLGSCLLHFTEKTLSHDNYNYISSSYADTEDVRSFWLKNKFNLIRLGNKLDQSSGTHSGLVIKALSDSGQKLAANCLKFFNNQKNRTECFNDLSSTEKNLVRYFIDSTGSYEAIKDILSRNESWRRLYKAKPFPKKANSDFRGLVEKWTKH